MHYVYTYIFINDNNFKASEDINRGVCGTKSSTGLQKKLVEGDCIK